MEAIILAGGMGTRLASRLNGIPKPMAPISGRPFLEILLHRLRNSGFERAILSVGHLHHVIQAHFEAAFDGMTLEYVVEEAPLGTGGAIRAALDTAREDALLVLNGDTFLDINYEEMMAFHRRSLSDFTIAVTRQADIARYGGVLLEADHIVGFLEKGQSGPGWINAGVYAMQKEMPWPSSLTGKFSFETDFLMPRVAEIAPAAFRANGMFLDIGIPEDLDRAQTILR